MYTKYTKSTVKLNFFVINISEQYTLVVYKNNFMLLEGFAGVCTVSSYFPDNPRMHLSCMYLKEYLHKDSCN